MNARVLFWSVTSALAGFLFGFDTVVISGAERAIQAHFQLGDVAHGLVVSSALYGTVVGALLGGWPAERFGRKPTLIGVGVAYIVSAVGCGLAWDVPSLVAFRVLGGVGIGVSTVVAPMYIAEIAPPAYRGRLTALFQFNIVFGIIVAFLSNYLLRGAGADAWRWMLGVVAAPAAAYTLLCLFIPESPRWTPGRADATADAPVSRGGFWTARLRRPIALAFLVAFFNQLSGINAVLYFAPRIFELAGLGEQSALLQSVGIGVTNLVFTFVGLGLIDRLGRRTLLFIGSVGYIVSLGLTAWAFHTGTFAIVPACLFAFVAAHAVGQGAVIWVLIAEVFPDRHRAAGQTLGSATHWVFAALITTAFPAVAAAVPPAGIFLFFCGMMVLQLLWVVLAVPETKGVPLEEVQRRLGVEERTV